MPLHDVHIRYQATEGLDEAAIASVVSSLSDEERAQYRRFHFARDARDYAAAHVLLRRTLSDLDDRPPDRWRFGATAGGKPFLIEAGAFHASFSLSHAAGMVACAVTADADVGVDVECIDREVDSAAIAARFFAAPEAAYLSQLDEASRQARFFDFWTLKEALVKALGTGMAASLDRLVFELPADGTARLSAASEIDPRGWQFGLFAPGPRHRLAVALRPAAPQPAQLIVRSVAPQG